MRLPPAPSTDLAHEARSMMKPRRAGSRATHCLGSSSALAFLLLGLSLAGCAPRLEMTGTPGSNLAAASSKTFLLVSEDRGHALGADGAVVRQLEARGFRQTPDAAYRVDIAFSSSEADISLSKTTQNRDLVSLCKRRRFALSVAMIDRSNGKVLFRRDAETLRCGTPSPKLIEKLAAAAIGD
jgi:hypothetical protein